MLKAFTVLAYVAAVGLDWLTSLILLERGHAEHNPLFSLLGPWFWVLKLAVSAGLLILLLASSERWWWTYLILWLPALAFLICGAHNLTLF